MVTASTQRRSGWPFGQLLCLAWLLLAGGAAAGDVRVTVNECLVLKDATATVQITVNNPMDLSWLKLVLEWDPAVAEYGGDETVVWGPRASSTDVESGLVEGKRKLILTAGMFGVGGVTPGNDVLISFTVQGVAVAATVLDITPQSEVRALGVKQNLIPTDGLVTVYLPPTDVVVTPPGGLFRQAQSVTLDSDYDTEGIYYTVDGSAPDKTKTLYTGAFDVDAAHGATVTVRARAFGMNGTSSGVTAAGFEFDKQAPRLARITTTAADGWYKADASIPLTVEFDEAVTLSGGGLVLGLNTGGRAGQAVVAPFTAATSATTNYLVAAGDSTADLTVQSVTLGGGAGLTDAAGNAMTDFSVPAGRNLGDLHEVRIDTAAPTTAVTTSGGYGPNRVLDFITGTASDLPATADLASGMATVEIRIQLGTTAFHWNGSTWVMGTPPWLVVGYDGGTGRWEYDMTLLWPRVAEGASGTVYNIAARGTDLVGNVQAVHGTGSFVYDSTPPTVSVGAPSRARAKSGLAVDFPVTVTGAANSELTAAEVTLVRGGAADGTVVVLDGMSAAPTVRVTPTGVGEGTLAVQVQAAAVADEALNPNLASNESAAVEIDNTLPTLAGVAIASNNADTAQAKPGDTVTLVFTASEPIVAPTVLIAGQAADSVENTGGNAWSATRTLGGNDPEGVVAFRIEFADLAGNDGTAVETTSDGSSVTFDRTPPNPPVVTPPASPTANLRPEWTWVSGGGGMALYQHQLDGTGDRAWSTETATTSFTPAADLALGEHTLYVRERDAAGNWSAPGGASVTVCWSVTVTLRPGWNLVSFPGVPWASDAAALLRQVAAGQGWHWTSGPYAAATTLTGQTGYWLARIGDEVKVTVRGGALVGDPPVLAQGWNLIGVAWRTAMADVDARVYRPGWTWNAARGRFGTVRNGASLEVGVAYWLYSAAPDVPLPAP